MATKKKTTKKGTAAKAAKKGASGGKASAKKPPAPKPRTRKTTTGKKAEAARVSPEDNYKMVQEAAYFQAEADGFSKDPSVYWLAAAQEIQKRLNGR